MPIEFRAVSPENQPAFDAYSVAFRALADATDAFNVALGKWYEARAKAEAEWAKLPEITQGVCHPPKRLSPTRDPAVKWMLIPPWELTGLPETDFTGKEGETSQPSGHPQEPARVA